MLEVWNAGHSSQLYQVETWGEGYFKINEKGNVSVHPHRDQRGVDLNSLVNDLVAKGFNAPILFRFD